MDHGRVSIRYRFDPDRVIPVPFDLGDAHADAWASETATAYAERQNLTPDESERVSRLLADVAATTEDGRAGALIYLPEPGIAGAVTVSYTDRALRREEQADFLWPRSAVQRPVHETIQSTLGEGVSTTVLELRGETRYATKRWLFVSRTGAVGVMLGPVPAYVLVFLEPVAQTLLADLRVDGFAPDTDGETPGALAAAFARTVEGWQV